MVIVRNDLVAVSATSTTIIKIVPPSLRRTQIIISAVTAAVVVTIAKGQTPAIANYGIVLQPTGTFIEANDSGFTCHQGEVQAVATGAGYVSITETLEAK